MAKECAPARNLCYSRFRLIWIALPPPGRRPGRCPIRPGEAAGFAAAFEA